MSPKKAAVTTTNSTTDLLRMFHAQPNHHVVTRKDLAIDYNKISPNVAENAKVDENDDDDDVVATTSGKFENAGPITINNYYTWNSHRTNKSFHKERAELLSTLHLSSISFSPTPSRSQSQSPPAQSSKSFTRSHRVRDIVHMCSDGRIFSTDDYHNNETAAGADGWHSTRAANHGHGVVNQSNGIAENSGRGPIFKRTSGCWSCTATRGSNCEPLSVNRLNDGNGQTTTSDDGVRAAASVAAGQRRGKSRPAKVSGWNRTLSRIFRKKPG
ncbi:Hypothetical protein CINCED_3A025121 [Cinara cedri]|uniref:Uncharacterized protein n=1 Tax=Cinara cedri TaxID=506608 RepID=A0A5E4NTK3_9HEMI|nr:Hypothetical protein CINCED_3A025121 [Cinara cedri]